MFRIGKKETDLKTEELINNPNRLSNNSTNQQRDIEMNPINNNNNVNIVNEQNLIDNNSNYPNQNLANEYQENSLNYPSLDNNQKKAYEENLD